MMKTYEEALKKFKKEFSEIITQYPPLESSYINMFNFGFSEGAEWMNDQIKK